MKCDEEEEMKNEIHGPRVQVMSFLRRGVAF
jgi:hypothetical protein